MSASRTLLAGALVVAAGCRIADIDYNGKQCPCPQGYACEAASNTCARSTASDGPIIDGPPVDAMPCPANGFFCDGFETGDVSRWTSTYLSPMVTLDAENTNVHGGKFALDANVPAMATGGAIAAVVDQFPPLSQGTFAVRAWIYLPQPLIHFDSVMTMVQSGHVLTVDADDNSYWTFTEHTPTGNPPDEHSTTLSVTNAWTCIEVDYDFAKNGGAATITLYIADKAAFAAPAADPAAEFGELRIGISRADAAGDHVIVDDVVLATQHVGCN
jgi:hypothetical protein